MKLLGVKVIHSNLGHGIITDISDKYLKVCFESTPNETMKFQYPMCFDKLLRFENGDFASAVADDLEKKKTETIALKKAEEDAYRQEIAGFQKVQTHTASRSSSRRAQGPKFASDDIRCNNLKGLLIAESISIDDDYRFDRIVDVMNGVFGWNYGACMKGFYHLNDERTAGAWFPQMAVIENGVEKAQSTTKDWINVLSKDGMKIKMYTRDPSLVITHDGPSQLHLTFARFPGQSYKYIGTFVWDTSVPYKPMEYWYKRIATSFRIADYRKDNNS